MTKILPNVFNEIISLYFSYYIHVVLEKRPESIFGQIFFPHFNSGSPVTKKSGITVCFIVSKISSTDVLFKKKTILANFELDFTSLSRAMVNFGDFNSSWS